MRTIIKNILKFNKSKQIINQLDVTIFLRQFAALLSAGIPIIRCCEILESNAEKHALRLVIYSIKKNLLQGKSFSFCLQQHSHYFDRLAYQLAKIGEHTGKLEILLTNLATIREKNTNIIKKIQRALFYPMMILSIALVVTVAMLLFIIPKFAELFANIDAQLPFYTRLIFYIANTIQNKGWLICIITLILVTIFYSQNKRLFFYKFFCTFPGVKQILEKMMLARFANNLAITLIAGIPITEALLLIANVCAGPLVSAIKLLHMKTSNGKTLHQAMSLTSAFPISMIQMVQIGEEAGSLDTMLSKVAEFYEKDVEQLLSCITKTVEPLIMLILGVLIGGLVIGMYLPIFKLGSAL